MLYIIDVGSTDGHFHETHHADCKHLPDSPHQEELGKFNEDAIAMIFAKERYHDADGCFFCMPDEHHG